MTMTEYVGLFRLESGDYYARSDKYTSSSTHLIEKSGTHTLCGIEDVEGFIRVEERHAQCPSCLSKREPIVRKEISLKEIVVDLKIDYRKYQLSEKKIINPQLEKLGYTILGPWETNEKYPLLERVVNVRKDGKEYTIYYSIET